MIGDIGTMNTCDGQVYLESDFTCILYKSFIFRRARELGMVWDTMDEDGLHES